MIEEIEKIEKQLLTFHEELSEAFENEEKTNQLYASNITITMGSQTFELSFTPESVDCITEALVQFCYDYRDCNISYDN